VTSEAQLLPGTFDLLILKAVSLGPIHGYGIQLRIEQISSRATSQNNRRARFNEVTSGGRRRSREEAERWNRLASALAAQTEEI
jgi:PadR family transcriptional regulator, regulatory protein PadR